MRIAELVELPGFSFPDIGESLFDCLKCVFADGILVGLGGHEAGDHFIVGLPGVCPEFHERLFGLLPDPDGDGFHGYL